MSLTSQTTLAASPGGQAGEPSSPSATSLPGRWLLLARLACGAGALLAVGLFTLGHLVRFAHLGSLASFDVPSDWSPETVRAALAQLGLSVGLYQVYWIACDLVFALCFFLVAALLVWHASNERMALLVAQFLLIFGAVWPTPTDALATLYPAWSWLFTLAEQLSWALFLAFFFLYPDGRFVPRWMRWWWVALVAGQLLSLFAPLLHDLSVVAWLSFLASALLAQLYRYRHHASLLQRQQIKWAVFGFGVTLSSVLGYFMLGVIFPALYQSGVTGGLYLLAGIALGNLLFLPIPVCVGIALLRYRLWEIDTLINKALVYGLLTGLLGALYAGLIIGLQALARNLTGQTGESPLVIVVSTLAIAALVRPLRRRLQALIDRRFYRRKYDAQKTLTAFSAALRQEVNLEQVRERLLAVVQETMQPTQISLWLRPPERDTERPTHHLEPPERSFSG